MFYDALKGGKEYYEKPNDVPADISTVSLVSNSYVNNLQPSIPIIIIHELSDRSA